MQEEGMQTRFKAGLRGLFTAAAIGSLLIIPAWNASAAPSSFGKKETVAVTGDPGLEVTVRRPVLYPRATYQWPYMSGPSYGTVDTSQWLTPGVIHTQVGSFDLARGTSLFPAELRTSNQLGKLPYQYFIVQVQPDSYANGAFDVVRQAITATGGAIVQTIPVGAQVVRLTQDGFNALNGIGGVMVVEPYHPAF